MTGHTQPGVTVPGSGALCLPAEALDRLMPLHVQIGADGRILRTGPTMARLLPEGGLVGQRFHDIFALRRPAGAATVAELRAVAGQRLHLSLRRPPGTGFRGLAVPTAPEPGAAPGVLVNLSFGLTVARAVREHGLSDAEFAPTDLTVEMLYLTEAKTAVMQELRDLNARLQQAKQLAEEQALTDALTGLRNRRALERTLAQTLEARMPFGLMQIDLDRFKQVNDSHGHAAGDALLCAVAKILLRETRSGDTVARTGGDEFVIVFPGLVDTGLLRGIASRILAAIERPIRVADVACRISASIGLTAAAGTPEEPDAGARAEALMGEVDRALYASKNAGRARITVVPLPERGASVRPTG